MKVGDLVKYMSRVLLIVNFPKEYPDWAECIELGEEQVGRYRLSILKAFNESR